MKLPLPGLDCRPDTDASAEARVYLPRVGAPSNFSTPHPRVIRDASHSRNLRYSLQLRGRPRLVDSDTDGPARASGRVAPPQAHAGGDPRQAWRVSRCCSTSSRRGCRLGVAAKRCTTRRRAAAAGARGLQ